MTKKEISNDLPMRILKVGTCPSLSGRSQLTFNIGCDTEGAIHFRIVANTGSGQFNADWIAISLIEKLLSEHPASTPMTSAALNPVFRGRSSNSPAFLFAALKAELLVLPGDTKDSGYTQGDFEAFKQAMSALINSDMKLDPFDVTTPEASKRKRSKENT